MNVIFSPVEIQVLAMYLTNDSEYQWGVTREFRVQFGAAFHAVTDEDGNIEEDATDQALFTSEEEAFQLLDCFPAKTEMKDYRIGLAVHRKLYEVLLHYNAETVEVPDATREEAQYKRTFTGLRRKLKRGEI